MRARQPEWCHPQIIRRVHARTGAEEHTNSGMVIPIDSPVQCRRTVQLWCIHIHTLIEELPDGQLVPLFDRVSDLDTDVGGESR